MKKFNKKKSSFASSINVKQSECVRINKFLSSGQRWSRRQADRLITDGQVKINGQLAELGQKINPALDKIEVHGRLIGQAKENNLIYLAYYKPVGEICSTADDAKDKVYERFKKFGRLFTIGRLDVASEGLLILTNDGAIVNRLLKSRHGLEKTYEVWTKPKVSENQIKQIKKGVTLDDGYVTLPANVKLSASGQLLLTIVEGKNRQIRRMAEAVGLEVIKLRRQSFGKLSLHRLNLKPGQYKVIPAGIFQRLFNRDAR
jgi:23S rRNA pseudouridine2605 synthase